MPRNSKKAVSQIKRLLDSPTVRVIGFVSSIVTIATLCRYANPIRDAAHAPLVVARERTAPLPPPTSRSVVQSSTGAQSPNVRGVQRDVKIQYDSNVEAMPEGLAKRTLPAPASPISPTRSTIQTSHGAQSPNVNDVRGNVEIRYGSPPAGSTEKFLGGAK
jgi:hypothetical protein